MDVYEFFREYGRMFRTLQKGVTITNMYITVEGFLPQCQEVSFECSTAESEIDKIIQWYKNHQIKTRLQYFKEKYPNADTFEDGTPKVCASMLWYCEKCAIVGDYSRDCDDCWNEPVE